ncbi:MAG TPA: stage II sporulation protein M [Aggregatilineales bacterium]|nr:stage II sporulation protein M [Anaerolineales bacterium]HRE49555.1 stage II sporulation protein M [Aggregatilineales bacterium]
MTTQPLTPPITPNAATLMGESHPWRETLHNALIVTRREMRDSLRDWRIMFPIFVLTLVFPSLAQGMTRIFTNFFVQYGATPLIDNFLPLLPMIVGFFPVSISLVIALETFVGEKERRSLEPLLSTPLTNLELYLGKTFAAMIPPLAASYVGMGIYMISLIAGEQQWRPELILVIQILLLTTAQALVMVTGAVVVSSQTTSTRASNLLASFIIIPTSLLVLLESFIMITNQRHILWYMLGALVVADVLLFSMGARIFNREDLLGRAIDQINLRWAWRIFTRRLRDGQEVKGLLSWYRYSIFPTLRLLRGAALIVGIAIVGAFMTGFVITTVRPDLNLPAELFTSKDDMLTNLRGVFDYGNTTLSLSFIVGQNLRVLLVSLILGVFSFGVMSIFFAALPFGLLGYIFGQPILAMLGAGTFLVALIPHSLFEIPAILIASAAAVRLGAVVTRPPQGKGVWEAWLEALADWVKLFVGLVLPLLFVAALVEIYLTPRFVLTLLSG